MADWSHDDWDPEEEKRAARRKASDLGLDWDGLNALIRDEWFLWEARLDAFCRSRFARDGAAVPDWRRQWHRSKFRALLVKTYGIADVDPEVEARLPSPDADELKRRFGERARREFPLGRSGGAISTPAEVEQGVAGALKAMGIRPSQEK